MLFLYLYALLIAGLLIACVVIAALLTAIIVPGLALPALFALWRGGARLRAVGDLIMAASVAAIALPFWSATWALLFG